MSPLNKKNVNQVDQRKEVDGMIKRDAYKRWKHAEGQIKIEKIDGKESTGQLYYGEPPILLTMITSMAHTLVVKNKVFTEEELIGAIKLGCKEENELK
jgi:hypothetical protein